MSLVASILSLPMADKITRFFGEKNMFCISTLVASIKLVLYGVIRFVQKMLKYDFYARNSPKTISKCSRMSPPYHAYILCWTNIYSDQLLWISTMSYISRISPPNLVATMVSVSTTVIYIIGIISS